MDSERDVRFRLRLAEGFLQEAEEDLSLGRIELSAIMDDGALSSVDFSSRVCGWKIESWYTTCYQDVEEFQARQASKPCCLPERQTFFSQVRDRRCQAYGTGNCFRLLAQRKE